MRRKLDPKIRRAKVSDAAALAALSGELGYPASIAYMKRRISQLASRADHVVLVAEGKKIHGWIHACAVETVESDPYAEIRGIVVTESRRGTGIGTLLVAAAEQWAITHGYHRVRVRTNVKRKRAIEFYSKLGYTLNKIQRVFDKKVD